MSTLAQQVQLDEAAFTELESSFCGQMVHPRGELIRPGDPTYDAHRGVWNGSIDRSPALIARCPGVADVIAA